MSSLNWRYTYTAVNALASIADSLDATYTAGVTCDANGNITGVSEMVIQFPYVAVLSSNFTYDALNRLTLVTTSQVKDAGGGATYTEYTNRRHQYDALGRVKASALTTYTSLPEPVPDYRDHLYAGARHIGNADSGTSTYGARWHWAGSQFEYASPLNSPNADTAGQKGYNIARAQSPQQATWQAPTTAGDDKLLYGQGRPMAGKVRRRGRPRHGPGRTLPWARRAWTRARARWWWRRACSSTARWWAAPAPTT